MKARLAIRFVIGSVTLASALAVGRSAEAGDFGHPPSGEIPILFNDHTVYAKPDLLKRGRVLAALVRDGHIYVPLRSMFEQMGASVSVSSDGKTVTTMKTGSSVSVTLGKSEVVIDGETRPLDVPPMMYHGVMLVPVRVISEALGAYVLWVGDRRVVVVRYLPPPTSPAATPTPSAVPTLPPARPKPTPSPKPSAAPAETSYIAFVQGAVSLTRSYNEFSRGQYCPPGYLLSGAFAPKHSLVALKADYRQYSYVTSDNLTDSIGNHYTHFATIDGGYAYTPVFRAHQSTLDARLLLKVADPRVYVGVGYLHAANNYGYPQIDGIGFGIEKLPDLRNGFNLYGSAFYYPGASGSYVVTNPASGHFGATYRQQYAVKKFDVGVAFASTKFPIYAFGGFAADHYSAIRNAPIAQTHDGPYLGVGVKL